MIFLVWIIDFSSVRAGYNSRGHSPPVNNEKEKGFGGNFAFTAKLVTKLD